MRPALAACAPMVVALCADRSPRALFTSGPKIGPAKRQSDRETRPAKRQASQASGQPSVRPAKRQSIQASARLPTGGLRPVVGRLGLGVEPRFLRPAVAVPVR